MKPVNMVVPLLLLCSLVFEVSETSARNIPTWVIHGRDPAYSGNEYIQGFGSKRVEGGRNKEEMAKARRDADDAARAELATQIQVNINSFSENVVEQVKKSGASEEIVERYRERTSSSTKLDLPGIEITKRWYDKNNRTCYSLIVLNKRDYVRRLRMLISEAYDSVDSLAASAKADLDEGKCLMALKKYFRALDKVTEVGDQEMFVSVFGNSSESVRSAVMEEMRLLDGLSRVRENISITVVGGADQVVPGDSESFPKPIKVEVAYHSGGTRYLQRSFPIAFLLFYEGGDNDIASENIGRIITNGEGLGVFSVKGISYSGMDEGTIRCITDLAQIYPENPSLYKLSGMTVIGVDVNFTWRPVTLDNFMAKTVVRLRDSLPAGYRSPGVIIGNFTYQETKVAGDIVPRLVSALKRESHRLNVFEIIERTQIAETLKKVDLGVYNRITDNAEKLFSEMMEDSMKWDVLTGTYWDERNAVRIEAVLVNPISSRRMASAEVVIPKSVFSSRFSLVPENFLKIQTETAELLRRARKKMPTSLQVKLWVNKGDGAVYSKGEKLHVFIKANRDCYVRLLYRQADGTNVLLFPNRYRLDSRIEKNKLYVIPSETDGFDFIVDEPFGTEVLTLFASTVNEFPDELLGRGGNGTVHVRGNTTGIVRAFRARGISIRKRKEEFFETSCVLTTIAGIGGE